jgi:hypothetical protein
MEAVIAMHERFPDARITLDPNGAWLLEGSDPRLPRQARHPGLCRRPVRRRERLFGPRSDGRVPPRHRPADRDQHDRHRLAPDGPFDPAAVGRHPLADPHFWTMQGSVRVAQLCQMFGLTWGSHSNNHFDISLAMFTHVARGCPGQGHGDRHPLDLAGRPAPDQGAPEDRGRHWSHAGEARPGHRTRRGASWKRRTRLTRTWAWARATMPRRCNS